MEKKAYNTPSIEVVNISIVASILTISNIANSTSGNAFNGPFNGGSGGGRANGRRGWAKEW